MLSAFAYYVFVFPLSLLPMRVLYGFSNLLYFIFVYIFPYRKEVITKNLKRSFQEKTASEIIQLRKAFYKHFCDILIEGIKNLSISEKELRKRMQVENPELVNQLFEQGKSVLLVSGHFNNWEWLITAQNFLLKHQAVGIGMPLSNKFWDEKVNSRRARFGMDIIHSKIVKDYFEDEHPIPIATLILSDQSPGDSHKAYWMHFLNQQTGVLFGCELLAHTYDHAVVFFECKKIKRGYYSLNFRLISAEPKSCKWGEITEAHTKLLETCIQENPDQWMWSHKRWKRVIPEDLQALKEQQRTSFNKRFLYE